MYLPALSLGLDDVISVPVMGTLLHLMKTNFLNGNTKEAQKCQVNNEKHTTLIYYA
ncbi:hypothetical protein DPMN_147924 [Dreissena polymorpha]|uniref:Uncharacterized protein n=1 Tax=Dreissena polymorpha TaxID=45954 RepID=A0A9D4IZR3_DREPO|nr:hypothetical protein DPMN_147924 [Dreissena polymorpha]